MHLGHHRLWVEFHVLYRGFSLLLLFIHSVVSNSLGPQQLQQARFPCPPLSPRIRSNSCSLTWWCHPTISSSATPFLCPQSFPASRVFSSEPALHIRWPKYWCFSFHSSPTNEYSGLISFKKDRFDLLSIQGTLKSLLQHHSSKASILFFFFFSKFIYLFYLEVNYFTTL